MIFTDRFQSRSSMDTFASVDNHPLSFSQSISSAFEPYLSLWVESQEKQLALMLPRYRAQPVHPPEEEFTPQTVLPSSTDLFNFYRMSLAQCAKLSTGSQLLALSKTFAKYLDQYGQQVLFPIISASQKSNGPSSQDAIAVLNTADYCYTTCNQLEEKIRGRIDDEFRAQVDLQNQADAFMGIASAAIRSLVAYNQTMLEPSWREMRAMAWGRLENVGDQSTYVSDLLNRLKKSVTETLALLHKQQYARAFCDNLVEALGHTFLNNIVAARPINEVGAEQLLLDSYVLKKGFMELGTLFQKEGEKSEPPAR
jgi:vacuolar protein sorting-associated protein 53